MKSLILGIAFLFLASTLSAQTQKGRIMAGGNANISIQFVKDAPNNISLSLNPNFAKFFKDNLALGASVGLSYFTFDNSSSSGLSFIPFMRNYFGKNERAKFFLDLGTGIFFSRTDRFFGPTNNSNYTVRGGPGISLFLSKNISFDVEISYSYLSGQEDTFGQSNSSNRAGVFFGFQIFLDGEQEE